MNIRELVESRGAILKFTPWEPFCIAGQAFRHVDDGSDLSNESKFAKKSGSQIVQHCPCGRLLRVHFAPKYDERAIGPCCKMSNEMSVRSVRSKLSDLQLTRRSGGSDDQSTCRNFIGCCDAEVISFEESNNILS